MQELIDKHTHTHTHTGSRNSSAGIATNKPVESATARRRRLPVSLTACCCCPALTGELFVDAVADADAVGQRPVPSARLVSAPEATRAAALRAPYTTASTPSDWAAASAADGAARRSHTSAAVAPANTTACAM